MDNSWWEEHCAVIQPETMRLILVGFFGSFISIISILFNSFLFLTLTCSGRYWHSYHLYLIFLALFDTFLSGSYILLFPVNLFMDFFNSEVLALAWWTYMQPVLALCHITMSTSVLLILAAAFERYLTISRIPFEFNRNRRIAIASFAIIFSLLCKAPLYFEVEVVLNGNCTGVTEYSAIVAEWVLNEPYKTLYRFWLRTILTVLMPFILLVYFNVKIVRRLREQHLAAQLIRFATSYYRVNIRAATRMLVLISCTYLTSNVLNILISIWECVDMKSLLSPELRPFYTYSSDLISLLTVIASACRLPIYCACNRRIRKEVFYQFKTMMCYRDEKLVKKNIQNYQSIRFYPRDDAPDNRVLGTAFNEIIVPLATGLRKKSSGEEK